jgi:hypothetical protein
MFQELFFDFSKIGKKEGGNKWKPLEVFTFNNVSVILWQTVLLVEETRESRENHRHASHWKTSSIILYGVQLTMSGISTHNVSDLVGIGTDCMFPPPIKLSATI